MSTKPCVHTPGMPYLVSCAISKFANHRQLAVEDRIERRVLRRLAAEGVEERQRLVQVVHDRRMPLRGTTSSSVRIVTCE